MSKPWKRGPGCCIDDIACYGVGLKSWIRRQGYCIGNSTFYGVVLMNGTGGIRFCIRERVYTPVSVRVVIIVDHACPNACLEHLV